MFIYSVCTISESRGFDLSPVHSVNKTSDHTGALDLSPISKYKSHDSTFNNSDLEKVCYRKEIQGFC